jgi:DNA-binding winged helix-turn-helix (wHTH) protein
MTRNHEKLLIFSDHALFAEAIGAQMQGHYLHKNWPELAKLQEDGLIFLLPERQEELAACQQWMAQTGRACLLILPAHLDHTNMQACRLVRPFRREELLQQIESLRLQNSQQQWPHNICFDPAAGTLKQAEKQVELTERESALLHYLSQQPAEVSREVLLQDVWRYQPDIATNTLESTLYRLRTKLTELCGDQMEICYGEGGYKLKFSD